MYPHEDRQLAEEVVTRCERVGIIDRQVHRQITEDLKEHTAVCAFGKCAKGRECVVESLLRLKEKVEGELKLQKMRIRVLEVTGDAQRSGRVWGSTLKKKSVQTQADTLLQTPEKTLRSADRSRSPGLSPQALAQLDSIVRSQIQTMKQSCESLEVHIKAALGTLKAVQTAQQRLEQKPTAAQSFSKAVSQHNKRSALASSSKREIANQAESAALDTQLEETNNELINLDSYLKSIRAENAKLEVLDTSPILEQLKEVMHKEKTRHLEYTGHIEALQKQTQLLKQKQQLESRTKARSPVGSPPVQPTATSASKSTASNRPNASTHRHNIHMTKCLQY